jgi:radical SAM protein with 4Fe4S-binding SPASM domain
MPRIAERDGLVYVVWELTLRCDHACHHCGSRAGRPREDELTTEEALDVVRQLAEMGAHEITLIGGEAYLRDDWTRIARAIAQHGVRCTMTTGGRGITKERAEQAKDAGITSVSVSVDGLRESHDTLRGLQGSFDSAMSAIEHLRAADIATSTNTQLNRLSWRDLDALLERFADLGVTGWQMQLTVPMGRAAEHPEWLLQPWELLELYSKLADIATRGKERGVLFWPANNIGYFGPHETLLRGRGLAERAWSGCVAGKHALGIESNGDIKGCPSLPTTTYVGGNVRQRSIRDLWDGASELRFVRDEKTKLWGHCADCYYAERCRAGCNWTAHVFFGRPGNNPYCHHRALEHEKRGLRERLVRVAPAPGTPFDHGRFDIVVEPIDSPEPKRTRLPLV